MASVARRPTVLIVLHQEHSTPGRVGHALRAMGVRLDIRRPSIGDPLPKSLAGHDGVVVFGGPMCANDDCDWIKREIDWLDAPLAEEKPFLGICLGAQMLARALGARVFTYEDRRSEIGYFPIKPNAAGERLVRRTVSALRLSMAFRRIRPAGGRRIARHRRPGFPQSGLSVRQGGGRPAVPPRGHLPHDLPLDPARGGASDPTGRAAAAGPSRRLVPARRPRRGLARGLPARVAGQDGSESRPSGPPPERTPHALRRRDRSLKRPSPSPRPARRRRTRAAHRFRNSSATPADARPRSSGTPAPHPSRRFQNSEPCPSPFRPRRVRFVRVGSARPCGSATARAAGDRERLAVGEFDPQGLLLADIGGAPQRGVRPRRAPARSRARARRDS